MATPACCRCCTATSDRARDLCFCWTVPAARRCRCRHCLSWLRRAPRCRTNGCHEPAPPHHASGLCQAHERQRDARRRQYAREARSVRQPPRPPFAGVAGSCSMCGLHPLPERRRSWCSDTCVDLWNLAAAPAVAKAQLLRLHGATCWGCGDHAPDLELEHRRPLWSLSDDERLELRWWLPFNLQLLCPPCHRAKSKREAAERAQLRRAARSLDTRT